MRNVLFFLPRNDLSAKTIKAYGSSFVFQYETPVIRTSRRRDCRACHLPQALVVLGVDE
jgi:hypothetical protein